MASPIEENQTEVEWKVSKSDDGAGSWSLRLTSCWSMTVARYRSTAPQAHHPGQACRPRRTESTQRKVRDKRTPSLRRTDNESANSRHHDVLVSCTSCKMRRFGTTHVNYDTLPCMLIASTLGLVPGRTLAVEYE